jgi:hypothetical protein
MADISAWSPVDESNTAAPPNGWPENMQVSGVNNSARAMMGAIRRNYDSVTAQFAALPSQFLPLSGGTVTGSLIVNNNINAGNDISSGHNIWASSGAVTASYIHSTGNILADGNITAGSLNAGTASSPGGPVPAVVLNNSGIQVTGPIVATSTVTAQAFIVTGSPLELVAAVQDLAARVEALEAVKGASR